MINTKEKIYSQAFYQILMELGVEKKCRILIYGGPESPEEFTQAFYDGPNWKWVPEANISNVVHGDEPKGTAPSGVTYDSVKALVDAKFTEVCYKRFRKASYPPIEDYLDAVVKDDATAKQAYIDKCNAIKTKYAKDMTHPGNENLIDGNSRTA